MPARATVLAVFSRVGLCVTCQNVRVVESGRGSTFYMCTLSATDARFRKYPPLPVIQCAGYVKVTNDNAQ